MEKWVTVFLTVFLHGTSGEKSLECTPGATIPHPTDCSWYYICVAVNEWTLFICPWNQLFNSSTDSCEIADEVTCFITKDEDEETKSIEVSDDKKEVEIKQSSHEEEPDHQKPFYLLDDGFDDESKLGEPNKVNGSNENESSQMFISNSGSSEVKEDDYKVDSSEAYKDKTDSTLLDSSEKALDQRLYDIEESDESNLEVSVVSHELFGPEKSEEDCDESDEKKIDQTKQSYPYSSDTTTGKSYSEDHKADDGDQTNILEKREADEKDSNTEVIESVMEKETKDGHHKVEDGHHDVKDNHHSVEDVSHNDEDAKHNIEDDHHNVGYGQHNVEYGFQNYENERNVSMNLEATTNDASKTLTNSELYSITSVSGVNIMRFGMLTEPIANWTEKLENGWTDLQIFWKHPKDEDLQGSVHFKYPTDSVSDNLEIQHLILEILELGDEAEQSTGAKVNDKTSELTNVEETQTT